MMIINRLFMQSVYMKYYCYVEQDMTFQFVSGEWSVVSEYRTCTVITHHSPLTNHY
jgi:hypothetical protein